MIFANSRYESASMQFVEDGTMTRKRVLDFPHFYETEFTARQHVVAEGERLDQLAWEYYREPELWWVIAVANPELFYPEEYEPGTVIRIPNAPALL